MAIKYSWSDAKQVILLIYFRRVTIRIRPGKIDI